MLVLDFILIVFVITLNTPYYEVVSGGLKDWTEELQSKGIEFFKINRGGDITFHGIGQLVGYPILDLEQFYTDIGRYLRNIEEVIIRTMAHYGLVGERSPGETGVWLGTPLHRSSDTVSVTES